VGESSGEALCIIQVAEEVLGASFDASDAVNFLELGVRSAFLFYSHDHPEDPRNFNVLDEEAFLSCLTLKEVSVRYVSDQSEIDNFRELDKEYAVQRFLQEDFRNRAFYFFRRPSWNAVVPQAVVKSSRVDKLIVFTVD
jgi:hypothetical protein